MASFPALVDFTVGVVQFRVLGALAVPHPAGRFPCRRCSRLGVQTWSRHVDTVRKRDATSGLFELVTPDTPDYDLAANTFRREHVEAGPLCEVCFECADGRVPEEPRFTRELEGEA